MSEEMERREFRSGVSNSPAKMEVMQINGKNWGGTLVNLGSP